MTDHHHLMAARVAALLWALLAALVREGLACVLVLAAASITFVLVAVGLRYGLGASEPVALLVAATLTTPLGIEQAMRSYKAIVKVWLG